MTAETDAEFLDSMEQWVTGSLVFKSEHRDRLFALARRGAEMQWRPIEEAPKDGTEVLLYLADADEIIKTCWATQGDWWGVSDFTPTHFMPLPPPPTGEK